MIDVLVVDDDEAIAEFVSVILTERGYRVGIAADGHQAIQILEQGQPRLVLLDLTLPVMSGQQVIKAIRALDKLKNIPIVVMSAHSDLVGEARVLGASNYVKKPFDLDELFSCVATYAGARG